MPSALKEKTVADIEQKFKKTPGMIATEYHGLSVSDISDLRLQLRGVKSEYKVLKNRLAKIALNNLGHKDFAAFFKGPVGLVFQEGDSAAVLKILVAFAKDHEKFKLKSGLIDGNVITVPQIQAIAKLPSRHVLLGQVASAFAGPLSNFARVLNASLLGLVNILNQIVKQKEKNK